MKNKIKRVKVLGLASFLLIAICFSTLLNLNKPLKPFAYNLNANNGTYVGYSDAPTIDLSKTNLKISQSPMITVLTHGLGAEASYWSNNFGYTSSMYLKLAYDSNSMIEQLRSKSPNGATAFWARMDTASTFYLSELTQQTQGAAYNIASNTIEQLTIGDLQKHVIIVFDAYDSNASNAAVYGEFKSMLNRIVRDIHYLTGGTYPKINLIGHSRGGITNMQYALDYPKLIAGLYSLGTPYLGTTSGSINKLFGYPIVSNTDGFKDILDSNKFGEYRDAWNANYQAKYSHIDAVAYSGYSTLPFLANMLNYDYGGKLTNSQRAALQTLFYSIDGIGTTLAIMMAANPFVDTQVLIAGLVSDLISNALQGIFPDNEIIAFSHFLLTEINYDIYIETISSFPFLKVDIGAKLNNDLFVDLDSQLGKHPTGNYKNFVREIKLYDKNANYSHVSEKNIPIVHNLEARDPYFIGRISSRINLGTMPPFSLSNIPNTNNVQVLNFYYSDYVGALEIPKIINGKTITSIGNSAFANQTKLTSVTIPNSVTHLGMEAFYGCGNMTSVYIPSSVVTTGYNVFYGCNKVTITVDNDDIPSGWGINWNPNNRPVIFLQSHECNYATIKQHNSLSHKKVCSCGSFITESHKLSFSGPYATCSTCGYINGCPSHTYEWHTSVYHKCLNCGLLDDHVMMSGLAVCMKCNRPGGGIIIWSEPIDVDSHSECSH